MAETGKRYWWLKLPEDFFRQLPMKKLRRIAGGDTYTIIYLKMMLLSLKTEGVISYECAEGDFIENLALDIDEDEENVAVAVAFLTKNSLLENSDNEATKVLPAAINAIGSEGASAKRMRDLRRREKEKSVTLLQPCDECVTRALRRDRDRDREDIDKELEKENNHHYHDDYKRKSKKNNDDDKMNAEIFLLWEKNIMPLTPIIAEKLNALVEETGEAFVSDAICKAVEYGKRNFAYIQAVARNLAAGNGEKARSGSDPFESVFGGD